jgi:hypothetical protein
VFTAASRAGSGLDAAGLGLNVLRTELIRQGSRQVDNQNEAIDTSQIFNENNITQFFGLRLESIDIAQSTDTCFSFLPPIPVR